MAQVVNDLQRAHLEAQEERAAMQRTIQQLQGRTEDIMRVLQERLPVGNNTLPPHHGPRQTGTETEGENAEDPPGQNKPPLHNVGVGNHENQGERDGQRYRRLEMPVFDGEDPMGWVFRMERYSVNGISEAEKLDAAIVGLEGKALNWFQWAKTRAPI